VRTNALLFVLVTSLAGLGAGCGETEVPLFPSYERDIKPLMAARCTRCHGAGGTLNVDPDSVLAKQPPPNMPKLPEAPKIGDFTRLENANGHMGLMSYTGPAAETMQLYIRTGPMPPPPAPPLTDREYELLMRWLAHPAP
jgi:hypothetical protein